MPKPVDEPMDLHIVDAASGLRGINVGPTGAQLGEQAGGFGPYAMTVFDVRQRPAF